MKTIKINAYEYNELNDDAKFKVKLWLDEFPFDYDTGEVDENGKSIMKYDYASEWDESDIIEHCEVNGYIFDKYGDPIHHLDINRNKQAA